MSNEAIQKFAPTATTALSITTDVVDGANSYTTAGYAETLLDNTLLYPLATATLHLPDGWLTTAPDDGSTIDLFMVRYNVDGTSDCLPLPAATDLQGAEYVGSFPVSNQTAGTEYRNSITISLAGVQAAQFYIQNNTGQTLDYVATALTLKVLPFTYAPAA